MNETTRKSLWERCGDTTPQDRRNLRWVLAATFAWAVCYAGGTFLIKKELVPEGPVSWLIASLPAVAGALVVLSFVRFLRDADELQRTIQLKALGLGFGGAYFGMAGYHLFERLGAPTADAGDFILVMMVFYSIGGLAGWMKYR